MAVAYRRRTCPQVVAAKQLIAAGRIGRVVFARTHYSGRWDPQAGDWRIEPDIGGALMEMASHRIEVLLNFGGRPQSVSAVVDAVDHDWPVDDTDALIVRFEGGGIGMHSTILTSPPRRDFAQIDGDGGRILIDPLELTADHLILELPDGTERIEVEPLQEKLFDLPMIEDFATPLRSAVKNRSVTRRVAIGCRRSPTLPAPHRVPVSRSPSNRWALEALLLVLIDGADFVGPISPDVAVGVVHYEWVGEGCWRFEETVDGRLADDVGRLILPGHVQNFGVPQNTVPAGPWESKGWVSTLMRWMTGSL